MTKAASTVEGDPGRSLVQFPAHSMEALRSDKIAQGNLKSCQGQSECSLSGQPVPQLGCPHGDRGYPCIWHDYLSFQFSLPLCTAMKSLLPSSWGPAVHTEGLLLGPPKNLFQAEQAQLPQQLLVAQLLQPPASLVSFCWTHFSEH